MRSLGQQRGGAVKAALGKTSVCGNYNSIGL
jgi:hypothetical protein